MPTANVSGLLRSLLGHCILTSPTGEKGQLSTIPSVTSKTGDEVTGPRQGTLSDRQDKGQGERLKEAGTNATMETISAGPDKPYPYHLECGLTTIKPTPWLRPTKPWKTRPTQPFRKFIRALQASHRAGERRRGRGRAAARQRFEL